MAEKPQCKTKGCENQAHCRGWCRRCYDRQRPKDLEKQRRAQKESQARLNADPEYRERQREYRRNWRKKNSKRRSAELRERYANDPEYRERVRETSQRWRESHPDRVESQRESAAQKKRERYANDPEYRERVKTRVRDWQEANRETKQEMDRKYREENRDKIRAKNSGPENLARKRRTHAELKMEMLLAYGDGSCAYHEGNFGVEFRPDDIFELELHHVNGDGAEHRKRVVESTKHRNFSQKFYLALRDAGWPTDVPMVTLCGICHKKETLRFQREALAERGVPTV